VHFEYVKGIGAEALLHARGTFAGPPAPSPAVRLAAQSHSDLSQLAAAGEVSFGHFSTVPGQGEGTQINMSNCMYQLQGNAVGVALRCLGITVRGSGLLQPLPRD
jgi:hypothetical protein